MANLENWARRGAQVAAQVARAGMIGNAVVLPNPPPPAAGWGAQAGQAAAQAAQAALVQQGALPAAQAQPVGVQVLQAPADVLAFISTLDRDEQWGMVWTVIEAAAANLPGTTFAIRAVQFGLSQPLLQWALDLALKPMAGIIGAALITMAGSASLLTMTMLEEQQEKDGQRGG